VQVILAMRWGWGYNLEVGGGVAGFGWVNGVGKGGGLRGAFVCGCVCVCVCVWKGREGWRDNEGRGRGWDGRC
jgi:hypothetical protein